MIDAVGEARSRGWRGPTMSTRSAPAPKPNMEYEGGEVEVVRARQWVRGAARSMTL